MARARSQDNKMLYGAVHRMVSAQREHSLQQISQMLNRMQHAKLLAAFNAWLAVSSDAREMEAAHARASMQMERVVEALARAGDPR